MTTLTSALEHYRRQQRIIAAGIVAAERARARGSAAAADVLTAFQLLAARDGADSVALMLAEQNIEVDPVAEVVPASVVGVASDGRPLGTLLDQATTNQQFQMIVATQLQDVARAAAGMSVAVLPNIGYVRMLNPPSCSRCAVLAGKFFKWNDGFQRHPLCDCRHVPSTERDWHDVAFNQHAYFDSLPTAEDLSARYPDLTVKMRQDAGLYSQEDIFTKIGARAIRDGADMNQVVNARRGMEQAQVFRRDLVITSEGTTRRGLAFDALSQRGSSVRRGEELVTRNTRTGPELRQVRRERARAPRVMPESIYEIAKDQADAIRLLRINGFIL